MIDLAKVRAETRGCEEVIHFNNAGSALPPASVVDAVIAHLKREEEVGGYEAAAQAQAQIDDCYRAVAELIKARPEEIAFVENATRAWDMAFYSLAFQPGDRILTARAEYASNYIAFLQAARKTGVTIDVVPSEATGEISVSALESMIDPIREADRDHPCSDQWRARQSGGRGGQDRAGQWHSLSARCLPIGRTTAIDVEAIGCDMLSATGRKYLRGPRGTGFLYVRRGLLEKLEPPFLDLHAAEWVAPDRYEIRKDARRFENWERYVAGQIGLGVAARYALALGPAAIETRVKMLAAHLRKALAGVKGVVVEDIGREKCGIVSFAVEGHEAGVVKQALGRQKMNVSVSGASSTLLDMNARGLSQIVRASVHYYNTEDEIALFAGALAARDKTP